MKDNYRTRYCPLCGGVVKCDLKSNLKQKSVGFAIQFTAYCTHCGLEVSGNKSSLFELFIDSDAPDAEYMASRIAESDKDEKWLYVSGNFKGVKDD